MTYHRSVPRAVIALTLLAGCKSVLGIDDGVVANTDARSERDGPPGDTVGIDADIDAPIDAPPAWWDPTYPWRHEITFDTTGLAVPLAGMPLLVRLPASAIGTPNGDDLRFIDATHTTQLPFEIDNISAGGAQIWVKIDLTASTRFFVYGGKSSPTPASNGGAVFGDYESVHHLQSLNDSSGRGHTAAPITPSGPVINGGLVGQSSEFNGPQDSYSVTNGDIPFRFTTTMNASAWIRVSDFSLAYQAVFSKGDAAWRLQRDNNTNHMAFGTTTNNTIDNLTGAIGVADDQWHHVAISVGGGMKYLYVDGVLEAQRAIASIDVTQDQLRIGGNSDAIGRYWDGKIDEARISALPRSAAQFQADIQMVTNANRLVVGARELVP